jgi:hypothetical protein
MCGVSVRDDCRHYVMQTVGNGDRTERCRMGVAETVPFACAEGCVFYEARQTATSGWQVRARGGEHPPNTMR